MTLALKQSVPFGWLPPSHPVRAGPPLKPGSFPPLTQLNPESNASSYDSNTDWKGELAFHKEYNCAPPVSWEYEPASYVTCRTGPEASLRLELLANGSSTNARFCGPFWIRPLLRPQFERMKDCASFVDRVAVGKGRVVQVVRENWVAAASGETWAWACKNKAQNERSRSIRRISDGAA